MGRGCVALARNGHAQGWPPIYSGQLCARRQLVKLTGALHSASKSRVAVLSSRQLYLRCSFTRWRAKIPRQPPVRRRACRRRPGQGLRASPPPLRVRLWTRPYSRRSVRRCKERSGQQVASASTPSDSAGTSITVGQTSNVATSGELRAQVLARLHACGTSAHCHCQAQWDSNAAVQQADQS